MKSYSIDLHGKILRDIDEYAKKRKISREDAVKRAFTVLSVLNWEKGFRELSRKKLLYANPID